MIDIEQLNLYSKALRHVDPSSQIPKELGNPLILKGIIYSLAQNPTPQAIELLTSSSIYCPYVEVQMLAIEKLAELASSNISEAIDSLYNLVIEYNSPIAYELITKYNILPRQQETQAAYYLIIGDYFHFRELKTSLINLTNFYTLTSEAIQNQLINSAMKAGLDNWVIIAHLVSESEPQYYAHAVKNFPFFTIDEQNLLISFLENYVKDGNGYAIEAICDLFLEYNNNTVKEIALANDCAPQDMVKRALFYFLTEQWDSYDRIDFNYTLLAMAYEVADISRKKKLLELSRYSGRMEWFSTLSGLNRLRFISELNDNEWVSVINYLEQTNKWDLIWLLAQISPAFWSTRLLSILEKNNWEPSNQNEADQFKILINLSGETVKHPIVLQKPRHIQMPDGNITCLKVSPFENILAVGRVDTYIYLWDIKPHWKLKRQPLIGTSPTIRILSFSKDGKYLIAANGDNQIFIFDETEKIIVKVLSGHSNMIRGLEMTSDNHYLISVSFDGSIRIWRFPMGSEYKIVQKSDVEYYASVFIDNEDKLITSAGDKKIQIWKIPEGEFLGTLEAVDDIVTQLTMAKNGRIIVGYGRKNHIYLWNHKSKHLVKLIEIKQFTGKVTAIALQDNEHILALGDDKGEINILDLSSGEYLIMPGLKEHQSQITGLTFINDGEILVSSSLDGTLYAFDLGIFSMIRTPVGKIPPNKIDGIFELIESGNLPIGEKTWMIFLHELLRWRQYYDIQISEGLVFGAGEFDIQL